MIYYWFGTNSINEEVNVKWLKKNLNLGCWTTQHEMVCPRESAKEVVQRYDGTKRRGKDIKIRFHHVGQAVQAETFAECDLGNVKVLKIRRIYFQVSSNIILNGDFQPFQGRRDTNFIQALGWKAKIQNFYTWAAIKKCIHRRYFNITNVDHQHL